MHYRSPYFGSEPCLLRKSSLGPSPYDSNKSTMNTSVTSSHIRQDSTPALHDLISTNISSLSNIFPNNMINLKRPVTKDKVSPQRKSTENTTRSGTGLSQAIASLENSFVCTLNRKKSSGDFFKTNRVDQHVADMNQTVVLGNNKIKKMKKKSEDLDMKTAIMISAAKRNAQAMKDVEKELRKKELVIQIYEKLIEICRKKTVTNTSIQQVRNVRVVDRRSKSYSGTSESPLNSLSRSLDNSKKKRLIISGDSMTANNSLYNILMQKTAHSTLNRSIAHERIDSRHNLRTEEYNANKEENEIPLVVLLKKSLSKKHVEEGSLMRTGNRVRKVASVPRKRKTFKILQDKFITSNVPSRSNSLVLLKDKQGSRLNISTTFHLGCSSIDQTVCSVYTSNNNSRILKNNKFDDLTQKFENICSNYQKANKKLIQDIEILKRKIHEIQVAKQTHT